MSNGNCGGKEKGVPTAGSRTAKALHSATLLRYFIPKESHNLKGLKVLESF